MRTSSAAFPRILLVATVAGCAACRGAVLEPFDVASAQTAAQVITALVNDPEIGTRPIEVEVTRGAVRLSGRVRTEEERDRAIEIARRVPAWSPSTPPCASGKIPRHRKSPRGGSTTARRCRSGGGVLRAGGVPRPLCHGGSLRISRRRTSVRRPACRLARCCVSGPARARPDRWIRLVSHDVHPGGPDQQ